jgi:protoporphyrinogen oxidase
MTAIERAIAEHPGLFVTGSGFRGTGIPDCITDGRATAGQAAEWLATCSVSLSPPVSRA